MSNVLIGIIGVILFIGLALAGALFLGERFQESKTTSKAAAAIQAIQQIASAAELHRVETGTALPDGQVTASHMLVTGGYLKSPPINPNGTYVPHIALQPTGRRRVFMVLEDQKVCAVIRRQLGSAATTPATCYESPTWTPGTTTYVSYADF